MNAQQLKLIFKGRLEFGNQRTYDIALSKYQIRSETYFKSDVLFKPENIFNEEDFSMNIPQQKIVGNDKQWRASTDLFREIANFALVGMVKAWCVNDKVLEHLLVIEPTSDKSAVYEYQKGRKLADEFGRETEAAEALTRAIMKYANHAMAYERRGFVNYHLTNFKDALYDFSKSIDMYDKNPEPHYGRGKIRMLRNEWELAWRDFDNTMKTSIPHEQIYWRARFRKGECLFHLKKYDEALAELNLFIQKPFDKNHPSYQRVKRAWYLKGCCLLETNRVIEAIDAYNQSLKVNAGTKYHDDSTTLASIQLCKEKIGK